MNSAIYKYFFEWELITGPKVKIFAETRSEAYERLDELCKECNMSSLRFNPIPGNTVYYGGYYFQGHKFICSCHNNNGRRLLVG